MKIYLAQCNPVVGAIDRNTKKALELLEAARLAGADLIVFPELFLSGYPPEDLLFHAGFVDACETALKVVIAHAKGLSVIIGLPRYSKTQKCLFNSAAIICDGELLGFQDKSLLPTYDIFDERRYFTSAQTHSVWQLSGKKVAVTICEDIWPFSRVPGQYPYQDDPLLHYIDKGVDLHVNISASPFSAGKVELRQQMAQSVACRLRCPLVLCNQAGSQDGIIFDGSSLAVSPQGKILNRFSSFSEDCRLIDIDMKSSFSPYDPGEELFYALVLGVRDYFVKLGFTRALLGLSGGVDSALVACIAVAALGKDNVTGCFMPSRFTSQESREDAFAVARNLGIGMKEIPIEGPLAAFERDLNIADASSIAGQNLQARVRGMLLMALSNQDGSLVLNTSNKSELAVGFSTLYGDTCGAIAVIGDLLKGQVYAVSQSLQKKYGWIPQRVIDKEPTAELKPNQKDTDTLPPYDVLDAIIQSYVVDAKSNAWIAGKLQLPQPYVQDIVGRIHMNEYKRRQCPFALRVSEKAFSCGRRVPIVHSFWE